MRVLLCIASFFLLRLINLIVVFFFFFFFFFLCRYDVELFQKIEQLTKKRMELFPADEETVLILLERVAEAQRHAAIVSTQNI
jgi:hypothetical protein